MRTVWVSFDTMGRDCLEAAAGAGATVVGVVTLPGPIDPSRAGQCSFADIAERLGAQLFETGDVNSEETLAAVRSLDPELIFVVGWSQLVREPFIASRGRASSACTRRCFRDIAVGRRSRGRFSPASLEPG